MKRCVFTICAKNYIGLAKIMEKSMYKYTDTIDFFIVVADEFDLQEKIVENNILIAKNILSMEEKKWIALTFKYNITEFCTCIKPFVFQYFFQKMDYAKVCYFDPDILFFDSVDAIFDEMENYEILVTPHNVYFDVTENSRSLEDEIKGAGIFNFGFVGLSKGLYTMRILEWWGTRLLDKCFIDTSKVLFTDQLWGNFLPSYLPQDALNISRSLGMNVAPWNFSERKIELDINRYYVVARNDNTARRDKLIFVHFSGYDYMAITRGNIKQYNYNHDIMFDDIKTIFDIYKEALSYEITILKKYLDMNYTYNYYTNGEKIELIHRRIFHGLLVNNIDIGNPFDSSNKLFYKKLKSRKMFAKDESPEKLTRFNVDGVNKKLRLFNFIMKILYNLLGYKKYVLLLKLFKLFSRYENQVHLISSKDNVLY